MTGEVNAPAAIATRSDAAPSTRITTALSSPVPSGAGRKTQVHPLTDNDHIHTRLTHSLEVGCVGRSLGMIVGERLSGRLPDWITPADLG